MALRSLPLPTILFVLALALLWGGNVVAIKISLAGIPPFAAAGIRFALALSLIALWARIRGVPLRPRTGELLPLLLVGVVFTLQIVALNWGTRLTLASRATVMLHAYPVFVALLAHFLVPGDRLNWRKLAGTAGAFAGIVVVFWEKLSAGPGASTAGDLLCLGSGFLLGLSTVLIKLSLRHIEAPRLLVWEMATGVPLFFILSAVLEAGSPYVFGPAVVAALLYQSVVIACFCFLAWLAVLKVHAVSRVSAYFFTTPLWGVLASYLLLGEPPTLGLAVGAALVALGIVLVNRG
jgi:drug/metabolite transporter (DMT)-like permease